LLEFWIYVHNSRLHFGAVLQSYSIISILVSTYSSHVCTLQVLYLTRYTPHFPVPNPLSEHVPELLTIIQQGFGAKINEGFLLTFDSRDEALSVHTQILIRKGGAILSRVLYLLLLSQPRTLCSQTIHQKQA
jgi:hypothetical protein